MSLVPPFVLVDRYEVSDEIGRGGHATVYRAHDRVLGREVAVKLLRDEALSDDILQRFRQEVQVTAQLEHAHILHVYDTGVFEGHPYIVMELASGRALSERLSREGQLPVIDALQIARDVGLALGHAHARGVVHRDVKPENILLGLSGAILADFGIARVTQDVLTQRITSTGTTVGTVQYMSPEQLCAEPQIDGRSDQYSLACVLYEMLAGVRPHIAATFEGLRLLRMKGQHVPVSAHRPAVAEHVDDAIMTAMSSMPADRFRSMEEFLGAIGVGASGEFAVTGSGALGASGGYGAAASGSRRRGSELGSGGRGVPAMRDGARGDVAASWWTRGRVVGAIAGGVALVGSVAFSILSAGDEVAPNADGAAVFAIIGNAAPSGGDTSAIARLRGALHSELSAWSGVRVVDDVRRGDTTSYLMEPSLVVVGDSVRVRVAMRKSGAAASASAPRTLERIVAAAELQSSQRLAASMVPALLLRSVAPTLTESEVPSVDAVPARSMPALRKYVEGFVELRAGRLDSASVRFREAAGAVAGFAHAEFWAAQSGAWAEPTRPERWRQAAESAARSRTLSALDSTLATALAELARADFPRACDSYRSATSFDASSFVAWYGLGECQRLDTVVVRRPEGYRFRSSHWSAVSAYRRALDAVSTSEWWAAVFAPVMKTTYAEGNWVRNGRTDEQPAVEYSAMPSLMADSIAFEPILRSDFSRTPAPETWVPAMRRGRRVASELTARWTERWPNSVAAWMNRATALELSGQLRSESGVASASGALQRAMELLPPPLDRTRIQIAATRVALRLGDVALASRLAREALRQSTSTDPRIRSLLVPVAALMGNVALAVDLSLPSTASLPGIQASLSDSLTAFSVRAQLGECAGLAQSLERINNEFRVQFTQTERNAQRRALLQSTLRDAVPCLGPSLSTEFDSSAPIDKAFRSLAIGQADTALRIINEVRQARRGATVGSITWDAIFAEAWVCTQAGDTTAAVSLLRGALEDVESLSSFTLAEPSQAAGLRRGLSLFKVLAWDHASRRISTDSIWAVRALQLQ